MNVILYCDNDGEGVIIPVVPEAAFQSFTPGIG